MSEVSRECQRYFPRLFSGHSAVQDALYPLPHEVHSQHVERLAAYWAEALGGPPTYSDSYGDETTVVKMHSGNGEHDEMNRRAIACFDLALADVGLANDDICDKCCTTISRGRP
jgi:truncated hemoglobin YjbI